MKKLKWLGAFAIMFGIMSLIEGGKTLFTAAGQQAAGAVVPVILTFNFCMGFVYSTTGILLIKQKPIAKQFATFIAASSFCVFLYLLYHIFSGGSYELKTLIAMFLRVAIWVGIALVVAKKFSLDVGIIRQ